MKECCTGLASASFRGIQLEIVGNNDAKSDTLKVIDIAHDDSLFDPSFDDGSLLQCQINISVH
jgi:hypothetical protein